MTVTRAPPEAGLDPAPRNHPKLREGGVKTETYVFTRTHKDGLLSSVIVVGETQLVFENDQAAAELVPGRRYPIAWQIIGLTGSSLVAAKRRAADPASADVEIVDSTIRAKDHGHVDDQTDFVA